MHLSALGAAFDACFSKASQQTRCTGCTLFRRPHTPNMNKGKRWTAASHSMHLYL